MNLPAKPFVVPSASSLYRFPLRQQLHRRHRHPSHKRAKHKHAKHKHPKHKHPKHKHPKHKRVSQKLHTQQAAVSTTCSMKRESLPSRDQSVPLVELN